MYEFCNLHYSVLLKNPESSRELITEVEEDGESDHETEEVEESDNETDIEEVEESDREFEVHVSKSVGKVSSIQ